MERRPPVGAARNETFRHKSPRRLARFTRTARFALAMEAASSPAEISAAINAGRGESAERGSGKVLATVSRNRARRRRTGARRPRFAHRRTARTCTTAATNRTAVRHLPASLCQSMRDRTNSRPSTGGKEGVEKRKGEYTERKGGGTAAHLCACGNNTGTLAQR